MTKKPTRRTKRRPPKRPTSKRKATQRSRRRVPKRPTPKPKETVRRADMPRVSPDAVHLVRVKGTPGRGGGPQGEAWRIEVNGKRAGTIFINVIDAPPVGGHASIQIFLSRPNQGRGIGRVAYRKACEQSAHNPIYAHMRKSNIASRRAAEAAGFRDVTPAGYSQLIMISAASAQP